MSAKQLSKDICEITKLVRELKQHFEDDLINLIENMHSDDQCPGSLRQYAFDRVNRFDTEYKKKLAEKIKKNMKESSLWHDDDVKEFQDWFKEVFE